MAKNENLFGEVTDYSPWGEDDLKIEPLLTLEEVAEAIEGKDEIARAARLRIEARNRESMETTTERARAKREARAKEAPA
jgi:hypothetical protein